MSDSTTPTSSRVWENNAEPWCQAVRGGLLESRRVTDAAILKAITDHQPRRVLDMGCGEGWLARAIMSSTEAFVLGVDGSATLIERASQAAPQGHYIHATYETLAADPSPLTPERFDVAVFNFALFGGAEDWQALDFAARQLARDGRLIIQTLPGPERGAVEGVEEFATLPGTWAPIRYTSRSLAAWRRLLAELGLKRITHCVVQDGSSRPLSWILEAQADHSVPPEHDR